MRLVSPPGSSDMVGEEISPLNQLEAVDPTLYEFRKQQADRPGGSNEVPPPSPRGAHGRKPSCSCTSRTSSPRDRST
jgi:hypothetical protein